MKSLEQRAKEYVNNNFHRIADEMPIGKGMETIYVESATEQRDIDLEKAAVWLASELDSNCSNIIVGHEEVSVIDFIERFKKAMYI